MQRLRKSIIEEIYGCTLFAEDIEELIKFLEEGGLSEQEYRTDDYSFSNKEEYLGFLRERSVPLFTEINAKDSSAGNYIKIEISNAKIWIYCDNREAKAFGIFSQLKQYLKGCQSGARIVFTRPRYVSILGGVVGFAVGTLVITPMYYKPDFSSHLPYVLMALIALIALVEIRIVLPFFSPRYFHTLRKGSKYVSNSFVSRNKDQLILVVLSAITGGLITYIIQLFSK